MDTTESGILPSNVGFNDNFFYRCLGSQKVMSQYARFAREAASEVILRRKIHLILYVYVLIKGIARNCIIFQFRFLSLSKKEQYLGLSCR